MSTELKSMTDEELILALQQDRFEAYDLLVERFKPRLYGFIMQMVKNHALAEDLLQETFIRLWRHRMSYRNIARFSTWIYTIAANLVRSEMRKKSRVRFVDLEPREEGDRQVELPDKSPLVDDIVHGRMALKAIHDAMEKLPDEFREVIYLREVEELSYDEIVDMLDIPAGTVKSRINRARARLKELLVKDYR
jgi:RNA polymerase sigma-70 factor, ECF subfamily